MFDGISTIETMVIIVVVLLVIGPERLPDALRTLGLWVGRLQRSFTSVKTEIEKEIDMDGIRRQLHNEAVMEEMKRIQDEVDAGTDAIKAQTTIDPNKIMASDPASENKNTDGNAQGPDPEPAEDDLATTMVDESTQPPKTPPRTDAEVEAAYLGKQANLKNQEGKTD
jgi:sec-independent protein translocase protein TatB